MSYNGIKWKVISLLVISDMIVSILLTETIIKIFVKDCILELIK